MAKRDENKYDSEALKKTVSSEGMQTLMIYKKKVTKQPSLLASLVTPQPGEPCSSPAPRKVSSSLTATEEALFAKLCDRGDDEPKYVVRRKLAEGGMGAVYLTDDRDMCRSTILKVILPQHKDNMLMIDGFVREARITGRLEHPNIIPVHDVGFLKDYGIYFTMKHIHGECLMDILSKLEVGDIDYQEKYDGYALLNLFRKVCDAASFAHSQGFIHRDIKPHNIMVGDHGEVLLMDWGLAKAVAGKNVKSSPFSGQFEDDQPGLIKGSPAYMAPEQASAQTTAIDQKSDIFLLGATLYHIYTFFPPYLGIDIDDILANARNHCYVPPENAVYRNRDLPEELCRIINKAMAKDKNDRYDSVADMAQEIDDVLRGRMTFKKRSFAVGEMLVQEGEPGTECYIIHRGRVEVFKNSGADKVVLGELAEGAIVGEMALITQEPRSASVVALEETEALILTKELFTRNLGKLPPWMEKAIVALADRLAEGNTKLAKKSIAG